MTTDATPWYRQAWPWFLISLPASAVVAGSITFYIAAAGWDGPVAADYYRKGLAINEEIARSEFGRNLGVAATLKLDGFDEGDAVRLVVTAERALPVETSLRVRLVHPARRDADRAATLARVEGSTDNRSALYVGHWQSGGDGPLVATRPVAWQVTVESRQWRLDADFGAGTAKTFELRAH